MRWWFLLILVVPVLTSCETLIQGGPASTGVSPDKRKPKPAPKRSAEPLLTAAIHHFEEGNYAKAESLLRASLAGWLPTRLQRARAYKYLAFTYCVTDRVPQCREEFGQALRTDPRFTLTPGESGHPIWGPAFRSVSEGR